VSTQIVILHGISAARVLTKVTSMLSFQQQMSLPGQMAPNTTQLSVRSVTETSDCGLPRVDILPALNSSCRIKFSSKRSRQSLIRQLLWRARLSPRIFR